VGAFHSLIELGPEILPLLAERFEETREPGLRADIVAIAERMHTPLALPLLAGALRDPWAQVWKAALDGLVALHTPEALAALEHAHAEPPEDVDPDEYRAWVFEALQQAREAAHGNQVS
jgi:HEAT repeat protein